MPDEMLTIADIARQLQLSEKTIRRYIQSGDLVAHEIGGKYRISQADLQEFLSKHRKQPPNETEQV